MGKFIFLVFILYGYAEIKYSDEDFYDSNIKFDSIDSSDMYEGAVLEEDFLNEYILCLRFYYFLMILIRFFVKKSFF